MLCCVHLKFTVSMLEISEISLCFIIVNHHQSVKSQIDMKIKPPLTFKCDIIHCESSPVPPTPQLRA